MSEQAATAQEEVPALSPEAIAQIQIIKQQFHIEAGKLYAALCGFIQKLPIDPNFRNRCLGHLDDGILWLHEGLKLANFNVAPKSGTTEDTNSQPQPAPDCQPAEAECL